MIGQPYKDFVRTMQMHLNLKMNFYLTMCLYNVF
jgi:hypothetical protein